MSYPSPTICLVSSVLPAPTSAGEIILDRHLGRLEGWTVSMVEDRRRGGQFSWSTRIIKRLYRTRWNRWGGSLDALACGRRWNAVLPRAVDEAAVVLTVAHGDGCWAAQRFAKRHGLPLATIFHDWWPDVPAVHAPLRRLLEARFRRLYAESDLALCVSEGMKEALGPHLNSIVLYPIPGVPEEAGPAASNGGLNASDPLKVHYFGNLYEYGPMLAGLLRTGAGHAGLCLRVRGSHPNWPAAFREEMRAQGLWLDFAPRAELDGWLSSADALLVVMSFDRAMRRRMETSFPSKLTEYAQFGRPLVVWGPEYCSAVRWARQGERALCVTGDDPRALVGALEELARTPALLRSYSEKAREAAAGEFNPEAIQGQFLATMRQVAGKCMDRLEQHPVMP